MTVEATPLETRTVNPSTSSQILTPSGSNIGFSTITVNPYRLQSKGVTPSTSSQSITPDSGYNGLSSVSVGAVSLQSKTVSPSTSSQTVRADNGYTGLSQVTVNAANLQNKTVIPSSSTQYISADSGYYGLGVVTVDKLNTTMTVATLQQTETGLTLSFSSSIASAVAIVATGICLAYVGSDQLQFPYVITHYVGGFGRISVPVGNFVANYIINNNILSGYFVGATIPIYPMVSNTLDAWILA